MSKRPRLEDLAQERSRQQRLLNKSFVSWVEANEEANLSATWRDGVADYVAYCEQLARKLEDHEGGSVIAFGSGEFGQLGDDEDARPEGDGDAAVDDEDDHNEHGDASQFKDNRPATVGVRGMRCMDDSSDTQVSALVAGPMHNAALMRDGTVWTWGCDDNGVLGREGPEETPTLVRGIASVHIVQVSCGLQHSVALSLQGSVYCWGSFRDDDGRNFFKVPGASDSNPLGKVQSVPMLMDGLGEHGGGVVQVASGSDHVVAVLGDGRAFSWGIGAHGQLGRPVGPLKDASFVYRTDSIRDEHLTPGQMQFESENAAPIKAVGCGDFHTLVILAIRSRVFGCGLNQYAQLGLGKSSVDSVKKLRAVSVLDGKHIVQVSAGEHFSLARSVGGEVYSWGRSDSNQLGRSGVSTEAGAFEPVPGMVGGALKGARVVDIACGSAHALAVVADGRAYAWGFGESRQLGNGDERDEQEPFRVPLPRPTSKALACSAGAQHSVLLVRR